MADRIYLPRALDDNGDIVAGARATFFEDGTSTPLTVYSDTGATTPVTQPLVADATGTFAATFTTQGVKVVITDGDGVELPGSPYDPAIVSLAAATGAASVTFAPITGNTATNVQNAIQNLTTLWNAVTAFGKSLIATADAAAARTVLGLGNIATTDLIDEDSFATNSPTRAPSQQSVKAFTEATFLQDVWDFTSTAQTVTLNSKVTVAHGLGSAPTTIGAYLICTTNQSPFVVGDVIPAPAPTQVGGAGYNIQLSADATNIEARIGSQISLLNDSGALLNLTAGSWELYLTAKA